MLSGRRYWRSVEEFADSGEFRSFVSREFPARASELLDTSRRDFVKLMGAGLALAGAATIPGCRRPAHTIMPYSREVPEEVIPGRPLFYATSMGLPGGGAEGLLVETHEGRPTKVEGNPLHPNNRGRCSAAALASVLAIYDPDRPMHPVYANPARGPLPATWDDFKVWARRHFVQHDADGGAGLAFLVEARSTPAWDAARARVLAKWPQAQWVSYDSAGSDAPGEGSRAAFGATYREVFDFSNVGVVVSFDRAFTSGEAGAIANARGIGAGRRVMHAGDPLSRIYCFEPAYSELGALADHHVRLAPSRVAAVCVKLARALSARLPEAAALREAIAGAGEPSGDDLNPPVAPGESRTFVEILADDLVDPANRGRSVVGAGATMPPGVHALVHAMNAALGNVGRTVRYVPVGGDLALSALGGIRALAGAMAAGQTRTLVCLGCNPVYDAPADLGFAERYAGVAATICLSVGASETMAASTWALNGAHWLESWGDSVSHDGTVAPVQPMIAPLYEPAMSELELLAFLSGDDNPDGFKLVREAWARTMGLSAGDGRFESLWRRALHDGVANASAPDAAAPTLDAAGIARAASGITLDSPPTGDALEVVFGVGAIGDGRHGNNPWLQEMPHPISKVVWDNPALVSPATARALDLQPDSYTSRQEPRARVARLAIGERSVEIPVWVCPGIADNVVMVGLGYGRTHCGLVGDGVGVNTFVLRESTGGIAARGATLTPTGASHPISSTQNHWSLEGRTALVRTIDLPAWRTHAEGRGAVADVYDTSGGELSIAEQLGELAHTPANLSLYENPLNKGRGNAEAGSAYGTGVQWAMTIDMASCTGCNACLIACQSENNIPVVGKKEVAKGREMHWIRVDRYFVGELDEPGEVLMQPVACVQCENAPCETVCPVTATVHDKEGLNVMAYNRCIGTRYCMNNCPYKARRFNFFDWAQSKVNGGFDPGYVPRGVMDATQNAGQGTSFNQNFIPPRLRAKLDEISRMRHNPDVTVRGRGVMEKCTFCIQRINKARVEMKLQDLPAMPDGLFQTACQQACPTESIVFGDMRDPSSRVSTQRSSQRSFLLLGYLNTRPRTSHLLRVRNPNPAIRVPVDDLAAHGHGGGHGEHAPPDPHSPDAPAPDGGHAGEAHSRAGGRRREGAILSLPILESVAGAIA